MDELEKQTSSHPMILRSGDKIDEKETQSEDQGIKGLILDIVDDKKNSISEDGHSHEKKRKIVMKMKINLDH